MRDGGVSHFIMLDHRLISFALIIVFGLFRLLDLGASSLVSLPSFPRSSAPTKMNSSLPAHGHTLPTLYPLLIGRGSC